MQAPIPAPVCPVSSAQLKYSITLFLKSSAVLFFHRVKQQGHVDELQSQIDRARGERSGPPREILPIAGRFLNKRQLEDCARLYRFCRFVDDLVDEASNAEAAQIELDLLKRDLEISYSTAPVVEDFIALASQCQMPSDVISELIRGIESDLQPVMVGTEAELLRYCYRVAAQSGC